MKFYNSNNAPKTFESVFEGKPKQTGVGFVSIGMRIRGLLSNNKLDLSGVNVSDDYDVLPDTDSDKDVPYDETQDFMDKLDAVDKMETISSRLESSIEEQVSSVKASKKNIISGEESTGNTPPTSTTEGGTE